MRLTCPNCDAQYEVPDEVIPSDGRDVQCSNCGDTWYQSGPNSAPADTPEDTPFAEPVQETQPEPPTEQPTEDIVKEPDEELTEEQDEETVQQPEAEIPHEDAEDDPEPQPEVLDRDDEPDVDPDPISEADPDEEDTTEDDPGEDNLVEEDQIETPAHPGLARGMDPSVTGILREEAEREAKLRAAENTGLESQPELGLDAGPIDEPSRRASQARDRMARLKGENPALLAAAESGSRRGLLPDIEEINSTLRANSDPAAQAPIATETEHPPRRKSGFSRGFAIIVLLMLVMVLTYTNARQIAEVLPQADPFISSYVAWVDQARIWLDAKVSGLMLSQ
ncbi:thioredoxin [Sedimentitalea sp. CY04]|uniref:Thioredoxin n=1 Tax=Parasedimentitalea denitrificans TaxID=2211118 RepID=A0ABX0WEJ9_9RHOB|nr:zinc-ribbon domain-containing protein [Sedimentitalea sp. CY04]NIZ62701.1 thioredoxin [Sedimentitalea sp. CY04]